MLQFCAMHDGMSVGNALIDSEGSFAGLLPANVEIVAWTGKEGIIEYNDRLRLTEAFVDLVPYVPLIRAWLTAASESLTLPQAKQVMRDLITALYVSKRQMPYNYGGNDYLANDDEVLFNTARMVGGGTSGLVGQINNRLDTISYQLNLRPQSNTFRSMYLGRLGMGAGTANEVDPGQGFYGANTGTNAMWYYSAEAYSAGLGWNSFQRGTSPQYSAVAITHVTGGAAAPVPWETVNGSITTLSATDSGTLLAGILSRSQTLLNVKATKINAILPLTTLEAVIDFDITGGW